MAFWGKAFCRKIHNIYIKFNSLIPEATCITMTIKCQEVQAIMDFLNKYCEGLQCLKFAQVSKFYDDWGNGKFSK